MLYGIRSGSSMAMGEMVQSFTARAFDMKAEELSGYCEQTLALPTA